MERRVSLSKRRRIYEDAIYIVAQAKQIGSDHVALNERTIRNMLDKQMNRCMSIIISVLNYHEKNESIDGAKRVMLYPEDNDPSYAIEKSKFEALIKQLPENKELREALWNSFVKRDKKAIDKFTKLVA